MGLYIKHLSHYHPEGIIDNKRFEQSLDTTNEWIIEKTGIEERRFLNDYEGPFPGYTLAKRALQPILDSPTFAKENIGMIISASTHDDIHYPNSGNMIAEELGLEVPVLQIKTACTSVAYAIFLCRAILSTSEIKEILILNGEAFTKYIDYGDRSSCILFGDAASALVISKDTGIFEILDIEVGGKGLQIVQANRTSPTAHISANDIVTGEMSYGKPKFDRRRDSDKKFQQDGKKVVDFVLNEIPSKINSILKNSNLSIGQMDFVISHQSNFVMMSRLWEMLEVPKFKHLYNIKNFGNTGSSGWMTVLSENQENIKNGSLGLASVFGAGMTWANLILKKI